MQSTNQNRIWKATMLVVAMIGVPGIQVNAAETNLLDNGDFEAGNRGFSTAYSFSSTIYGFQQYTITRNPRLAHNQAASYGDHTSGAGLMMAINGPRSSANLTVWSQTIPVESGESYEFSAWVSSWTGYPPDLNALLNFSINNQSLGTFRAPSPAAIWDKFRAVWDSGSSTSATIRIIVTNPGELIANDFALDDLSLRLIPRPIASIRVSEVEVCWQSVLNTVYQLQYRSSLTTNSWVDLGAPVLGNGTTNRVTEPVTEPTRFYRVTVLP